MRFIRELSPSNCGEVGRPRGVWRKKQLVAVASELPLLYWAGRALYDGHRVRYRLSLYDEGVSAGNEKTRLALFDDARFPINDVAFHPAEPLLAVATGSYDGGYCFEGELFVWNYETDAVTRPLGERREIVTCRWNDEGSLAVLLRPRFEDEFGAADPFSTYVGLVLNDVRDIAKTSYQTSTSGDARLSGLEPIDPATLGFDTVPDYFESVSAAKDWLGKDFEARTRTWDLMWLSRERLAAVHDGCHVEIWNTQTGQRTFDVRGEGFGVQLLSAFETNVLHVHVPGDFRKKTKAQSKLYAIEEDSLTHLSTFDYPVLFSADAEGNLLGRDTRSHSQASHRDFVLNVERERTFLGDLGHYDCFNHYVRLDGGEGLAFLRGTPASSHKQKRLCRLNERGQVEELVKWDDASVHTMLGNACWVAAQSLVRSGKRYSPRPGAGEVFIERRDLGRSKPRWYVPLSAPATALVASEKRIHFALTDGTLGTFDIETGALIYSEKLAIDGAESFATSLALCDSRLAVGTIDGRVMLYELPSISS